MATMLRTWSQKQAASYPDAYYKTRLWAVFEQRIFSIRVCLIGVFVEFVAWRSFALASLLSWIFCNGARFISVG